MKTISLLASAVAVLSSTPVLAQAIGSNGYFISPAARVFEPPHMAAPSQICPQPAAAKRYYAVSLDCAGDVGQRLNVGQVFPAGAGMPIGYAQLTPSLRAAYSVNPDQDYVLLDQFLYELDHATSKIRRVMPVVIARR